MKIIWFVTSFIILLNYVWIITILSCLINFGNSIEIKTSVNATEFMKGSPAKLSCAFSPDPNNAKLVWENRQLSTKLICTNQTYCREYPGYKLLRNGDNITLIIEKVMETQNKWECTNIQKTYSQFITFNVIVNPPLLINITHIKSNDWEITSSCSNLRPIITCRNNDSTISLGSFTEKNCSSNLLSSFRTTFKSEPPFVKCHAERGNDTIDAFGRKQLETSTLDTTSDQTTNGRTELETSTLDTTSDQTTNGLPSFHVTLEDLPGCIYRIKTSCTIYKVHFGCVIEGITMPFKEEAHTCPNKFMKMYHVELKSLMYGSTFNCSVIHENKIHPIQKTVSCHVPYYVSGGILISFGIILAGAAVTVYLFKIGPTKHSTIWKFAMWYIGIIFVDIGVLLFLYTLSWQAANTVFLPFLLLLLIKDIVILLIAFYVKKNGGFFFINTTKVNVQTTHDETSSQPPNNSSAIQ